MGTLFEEAKQIEPWLKERGLSKDEIVRGMKLLLGDDWEKIHPSELFKRLQAKGYRVTGTMPTFADEMEGLIRGAVKLENVCNNLIYGLDDE